MKQCPKCKASLEENARFCLYCMASLDTKESVQNKNSNKWWLIVLAALLALAVICGAFTLLFGGNNDTASSTSDSSLSSSDGNSSNLTLGGSSADTGSENGSSKDTSLSENEGTEDKTEEQKDKTSVSSNTSSSSTSSDKTSTNETPSVGGVTPIPDEEDAGSEEAGSDEEETEYTPPANNTSTVVYLYRDATPTDDFATNSSVTNGGVVITGVETIASNGVYEIPETIGGKKVVAIMNAAFCDSAIKDTVKTVIIPKNVKTINAYAFYYCYNLTDIYIKGEAVACPSVIIPDKAKRNFTITIYASKTCHDRNFRTYKTLCELYWETEFKEWNG